MPGKVMSRSSSGSTKAKNTIVATPAAKKLGHTIAPTRCTSGRGGWSNCGSGRVIDSVRPGPRRGAIPLGVRQRPDVRGDQARAGFAEQLAVRRHRAVAAVDDALADRLAAAAVQPVAVGQVRCAQFLVALALDAVARDAHAF